MSLRVSIDDHSCELVGYCSRIAPDVFDTESGPVARVVKESVDDPDLAAAVLEAESICPTSAIAAVEES
jgi:ferredoxin